jgi:hypothetical protein
MKKDGGLVVFEKFLQSRNPGQKAAKRSLFRDFMQRLEVAIGKETTTFQKKKEKKKVITQRLCWSKKETE